MADITSLRIVFFGMSGIFTARPFRALLDAGCAVRALILPAQMGVPPLPTPALPAFRVPAAHGRPVPLAAPLEANARQLAEERNIPVLRVATLRDLTALEALSRFQPDLICVSCFSLRLPEDVLRLPQLGCLNIHPSLLPDNRGPDPLFWTFQRGDAETGVTIHQMDTGLDTGPILLQQAMEVPLGVTEAILERALAGMGASLLIRAVNGVAKGTIVSAPQDEARATRYPWPDAQDYTLAAGWTAQRAYRFACGVVGRGETITIKAPGAHFRLLAPLDFDSAGTLDVPWKLDGNTLVLRCVPGLLRARVSHIEVGQHT